MMISPSKLQKTFSAGSWIDADQDLLYQILVSLPAKSIIRFKSVSKTWSSLTSHPRFISAHHRRNSIPTPSGLFFHTNASPIPQFIHLTSTSSSSSSSSSRPCPSLVFLANNDPTQTITVLQSCNGLLLCSSSSSSKPAAPIQNYYVCNPTTTQFAIIPHPPDHHRIEYTNLGISLAFDPLRNPNEYTLVSLSCFRDPTYIFHDENTPKKCQFEIYSPGTGSWRLSGDPFTMFPSTRKSFKHGLFLNGAIHWLADTDYTWLLYFDIGNEKLLEMRLPTLAEGRTRRGCLCFLGECNGRLYIATTKNDVFEMKRDYSGWIFKYRVSPSDVAMETPEIVSIVFDAEIYYYRCKFVGIFPGDSKEDDDFAVVISVPGKIISYHPKTKSSQVLLLDSSGGSVHALLQTYFSLNSFHFIDTLYPV